MATELKQVSTEVTRTINAESRELVVLRLEKFQKRAAKLGMPKLTLDFGALREQVTVIRDENGFESDRSYTLVCDVTLSGAVPAISGYSLICKIEHTRNNKTGEKIGNMVKGVVENLPLEYATLDSNCDHCKTNRFRKETFILEKTEDQTRIQVGSDCLVEFMPAKTLEQIIFSADVIRELFESDGSRRAQDYANTAEFVATAIKAVKKYGWVPKSCADETRQATAFLSWNSLNPIYNRETNKLESEIFPIVGSDVVEAQTYINELLVLPADTTFMSNLNIAMQQPFIFRNDSAILAVVAKMFMQAEATRIERKKITNEHFAEVGAKIEIVVTVKRITQLENDFGTSFLVYMIEDKTGHMFKTFTTNPQGLEEGGRAIIKGTVKKHETYKPHNSEVELKSTMLTRIKVLEHIEKKADITSA